jgi:hypothetical protein
MPLNTIIIPRTTFSVGTIVNPSAQNLPGRLRIPATFNYRLNEADYLAGGVQFVYAVSVTTNLQNVSHTVEFIDQEPPYYDLGTITTLSPGDFVQNRQTISSLRYQFLAYSRFITISLNEASRPTTLELGARPRFVLSKTSTETFNLEGRVQPTNSRSTTDRWQTPVQSIPLILSGRVDSDPVRQIQLGAAEVTSTVIPPQVEFGLSAQSGLLTPNGAVGASLGGTVVLSPLSIDPFVINTNFPEPPALPNIRINRRTNNMDVTDGSLTLISRDVPNGYRPGSEYNDSIDPARIAGFGIWLRTGLTAQVTLTVLKCGESDLSNRNGLNTYVPGNLPAV